MKKIASAIITVLMVITAAFSFAGCKVSNTQKPDGEVKPDDNKEASVFLNVGVLQRASEKNLMQTWINAFQKLHPEVSITISKQYSSMDALIGYKTANALPDICWTAGDQHAEYSDPENMGYFRDLSDETVFEGSAKFFSGFYDELIDTTHINSEDGGIWFVPRDYNKLVIYYNKTVFKQMGIDMPTDDWTWEKFTDTCDKLVAGANGVKCKKAIAWRNWAPVHYTMVKNFGADYINDSGRFIFDSAEGKACYDWYQSWVNGVALTGQGGTFGSYSNKSAATPAAAMMIDTYANLSDYATRAEMNNWELDVAAFPNFVQEDGSAGFAGVGCSGYAITTTCTDETKLKWAWEFLKYCMSLKGYNEVAELGVLCPALKSMRTMGEWLNYDVGGTVINYNAYVSESTQGLDVNFQGRLKSTTNQGHLVTGALGFWNNANSASWNSAIADFKEYYESSTGIR